MPDLSLLLNLQKVCSCSHEKQEPPKKLSQNQSVSLIFELRKPKPLDFRLRGDDGQGIAGGCEPYFQADRAQDCVVYLPRRWVYPGRRLFPEWMASPFLLRGQVLP